MGVSRSFKCFVVMLATSFVITGIPLNRNNSVRAASVIDNKNNSEPEPKIYRSVEKHSYKVVVKTVSEWAGHANMEISFTNIGKETIHDWYFTFDYDYAIENPSNCYIVEHKDNLYTIANNNWNQDIAPGKSVKIGFTAASSDGSGIAKNPSFYLLNTKTVSLTEKELSYKYEEYSDWGSGFSGALVLTNASNDSIRDWTISFGANRPLTQADSASLKIKSDSSYTICNDGNNQNISKGKTYRIGIQGGYHDLAIPFELTGYTVTAKKLAIKISEDKNKNGIADVRETDYSGAVTVTPTPPATTTPTSTPVPTTTSTPVPTSTNTPTPTNAPTNTPTAVPTVTTVPTSVPSVTPTLAPSPEPTESPTPTAIPTTTPIPTGVPENIDYDKDSDSDGLPDDIEDYYGTDKNKADTDGDGVNDLCELLLDSDPKTADNIGSLDRDGDGLSNAKESELGTNPTVKDTDMDGLSDGEEYKRYGTDPLEYDTDEDGISDYNEVQLGSNPNVSDSGIKRYQTKSLKISNNTELNGVTEVTVSGDISGSMAENTKIKDIYGKDLQTSSITALVGNPVSIETTGQFSSMTITFKYSDDLNENNLRIMWFDEENCDYVVLNDYSINTSNNTISVTTNHFSKYMLIDEEIWVKTWADSMRTKRTYYDSIKPLYDLQRYKSELSSMLDSDSDGIPDAIETHGMITNTGRIIYTDPNKKDTDGDGLSDGYEMGEISVTKKIFDRSYFYNYIDMWSLEMGYRYWEYVYYEMKTDPTKYSSDSDDVSDGNDATQHDENEPINYILIGLDKGKSKELSCMLKPYKNAFKSIGEKVVVLEIYEGSDYQRKFKKAFNANYMPPRALAINTFQVLKYDLEGEEIIAKEKYSYVRKMIIIGHGAPNNIDFDYRDKNETGYLTNGDIESMHISCHIDILDIQACFCGKGFYGDDPNKNTCVAHQFIRKTQIDKVYAWTNECKYCFKNNYSNKGGHYEEFTLYKNEVLSSIVKTNKEFLGMRLYSPLQY